MKQQNRCNEYAGNFSNTFDHFVSGSALAGELIDYTQNFSDYADCLSQAALSEKAYDIEAKMRLLMYHAMESLNKAYDSGRLEDALSQVYKQSPKSKAKVFGEETITGAMNYFKEKHTEVDTSFLEKALAMIRKRNISIEAAKEGELIIHSTDENGKPQKSHVSVGKVPMSTGRISKAEFLGKGTFSVFPGADSLFNDDNCHHRRPVSVETEVVHTHDAYERTVNNFLHLKESAYRHARLIDEFGVPHLKGDDPFTIIVAIIGIVAAALIIAGVTIEVGCSNGAWSGDVCNLGWGLIGLGVVFAAGAIVCAVSGCTIIIGLIGATAAV